MDQQAIKALAQAEANMEVTVVDQGPARKLEELSGMEKTAILMLALGQENGREIWTRLHQDEIRDLSATIAQLGSIDPQAYEDVLISFVARISTDSAMTGNISTTESLLKSFLPEDQVDQIMEEIRGPAGRNMWEKLSNVQANVLASYLKNEYPQTVAVVLSKIASEHSAQVLALLPDELSLDVVNRMLAMESVQKDILEQVESTLRLEFMSNLSRSTKRDPHELMAGIFNNFDRQTEARFLTALEEENRDSADRIKQLMFTFDDLGKLDAGSVQALLREVEKDDLAKSLKGASETLREFFFSNMSARAAKLLQEDMEAMGPMRLSDVDEAQNKLVTTAKDMAERGDIIVQKGDSAEEMIY